MDKTVFVKEHSRNGRNVCEHYRAQPTGSSYTSSASAYSAYASVPDPAQAAASASADANANAAFYFQKMQQRERLGNLVSQMLGSGPLK